MNHYGPRPTSLPLIILTLLAGIALGWLLRDTFRVPAAQVAVPTTDDRRPTTDARPPATSTPAIATTTEIAPTEPPTTVAPVATSTLIVPTATVAPTATPAPAAPQIAGYIGHIVAEGQTLGSIAEQGGSTPELIARYNRLAGAPPPGRALIIPQLEGHKAVLASEPLLVKRGRADRPWVALTLDAGAGAEPVPRILAALRERNLKITFFLTGKWIAENPDLARQIAADGHEIANHTDTHPDLTKVSDAVMHKELADTEQLMQETAGTTTHPLFRPPYGAYDERVLRNAVAQGYLPIYWTIDSLDSVGEPKTAEFLLERVTRALTPEQLRGAIILAHCGSAPTAEALPQILDRFAEMGFEVKTVSEVLGG
jgi:peptidoglycan/xylan/chitin deacetylase (PgdA/CDA1 family)